MVGAVEGADDAPVLVMADAVGHVLHERPAAGDVDQLHPPADAQHRQVALDRGARKRDLERVALGHRVDRLGVRLLAVAGGVDVSATGEDQTVDKLERRLGILDQPRVGREHHHQAPRPLHGLDVAERQQRARWSHTLHLARSSAAHMPITGGLIPHTIGSTRAGERPAPPASRPDRARAEETHERAEHPA